MAQNIPTYNLSSVLVAARASEVPIAQLNGGGNLAASCAPGIGINTGNKNPKLDDWSVLDQAGSARDPQMSQHIGSPASNIQGVQGADVNDTLTYITALTQAAPGSGFGAAGADPVNRTSETIEVGDRAWGTNTV